jgi:TolB-like protein
VKLAALPFERAGIDEGLATLVQDSLVNRLAEKPFLQIVTDRDMAALLGLEREKQLLGCAGDSRSCVAELTGALGVEALVTGSIGRAGRSFQLNVKVIDAAGAKTLFAFSSEPVANEEALLGLCASLAESIAARFEARAPGASSAAPWVLVGVGAGVAVGGAVFALLAKGNLDALRGMASLAPRTPESVRDQGQVFQGLSIGLLGAGGAMVLGGVLWRLLLPGAPVTASAFLSPGAAQVFVQAVWP